MLTPDEQKREYILVVYFAHVGESIWIKKHREGNFGKKCVVAVGLDPIKKYISFAVVGLSKCYRL